jgi:hypothetical protein
MCLLTPKSMDAMNRNAPPPEPRKKRLSPLDFIIYGVVIGFIYYAGYRVNELEPGV